MSENKADAVRKAQSEMVARLVEMAVGYRELKGVLETGEMRNIIPALVHQFSRCGLAINAVAQYAEYGFHNQAHGNNLLSQLVERFAPNFTKNDARLDLLESVVLGGKCSEVIVVGPDQVEAEVVVGKDGKTHTCLHVSGVELPGCEPQDPPQQPAVPTRPVEPQPGEEGFVVKEPIAFQSFRGHTQDKDKN
jgi:hypothetical protein